MTPREEKLSAGLCAALEALVISDGLVRGLLHVVAMLLALRHHARRAEDDRRVVVSAHLRNQERRLRAHRGALDKAADRAVLAEHRLERARAALPTLRAAAEGRSRDAVRAAVEQVAAALGEGGSHGATGPIRGSVTPETMSPGR